MSFRNVQLYCGQWHIISRVFSISFRGRLVNFGQEGGTRGESGEETNQCFEQTISSAKCGDEQRLYK